MEYRIFFKDKEHELKGPFTERQVQEWYRKGWFDSYFTFYFTRSNESPRDEKDSGITLASLRSLNGSGCPFFKSNDKEKREFEKKKSDEEEKLMNMEKEIAELHQKFDSVLKLEKAIGRAEMEVQKLTQKKTATVKETVKVDKKVEPVKDVAAPDLKTGRKTAIARPDSISLDIWQKYYEFGCSVADLILDAFAVYSSGDFASWEKNRAENMCSVLRTMNHNEAIKRNSVCEFILVAKMKKMEFFYCHVCEELFFNYKQALVHVTSENHEDEETAAVRASGIFHVRGVLNSFTMLPHALFVHDQQTFLNLLKYGAIDKVEVVGTFCFPDLNFMSYWNEKYKTLRLECNSPDKRISLADRKRMLEKVKSKIGQNAFAELHNNLAQGPTYCFTCKTMTGELRDSFYAHILSCFHLMHVGIDMKKDGSFCLITAVVNVHRRDLV